MDFQFDKKWRDLVKELSQHQDEPLDLQSILFLIGVQELNKGYLKLNKNQKIEVMHIAICTLLEPYGFYEYSGHDDEGWPHFEPKKNLPNLQSGDQEKLIKKSILEYFNKAN